MNEVAAPRWAFPVLLMMAMSEAFGICMELSLRLSVTA
jgi:hypothetical protein